MHERSLVPVIAEDLTSKMVFISGPRQVGKTTIAKSFAAKDGIYLTWDDLEDRDIIKRHKIDPRYKSVVFDEIHKYIRWRTLVKGLFDKYGDRLKILVTGSARLDYFRKGGDSLVGRYHALRLHPFSLPELDKKYRRKTTELLLQFGGFPEPVLAQNPRQHRRWQRERIQRVIYQDVRDLTNLRELSLIELLVDALPMRVGSVLSIKSLQEDLEVSPNTVTHWLQILDLMFYSYRVLPYGSKKIRAVKKSTKLYLWDWSEVQESAPRFENMVAGHLLKYCHYLEDSEGYKMELRFIRDTDLREIDFVVLRDKKPLFAVECKTGEKKISPNIKYFRDRTDIPLFYQVHLGKDDYQDKKIRVLPFETFCREAGIP